MGPLISFMPLVHILQGQQELIRKYIEKEAEHLQQAGPGETGAILELGAAIIQRVRHKVPAAD